MNNVYEKLKEAKAEIEKLKAELRGKKGSLKNLKRSHDVQVNQIQEAISKVEKLEHELLQKSHAFIYAEPIYENHNLNLSLVEPQEQERTIDRLKRIKPSFEECELEKYTLLDEISLLKFRLDSHVKLSQDLQHQLQMCKQLLAQEESHRKSLEGEVLDLKLQFEGINSLKDKDIENLRHAFKAQERCYKESKYSNEKLEQENHRLRKSLRELRESQDARAWYSLSTLRSSLSSLEQTHKECVSVFTSRKLEWRFQLEQMTETIDNNRSKMETKDATIEELEMELECSCSFKSEMEFELQMWKSFVESLKKDLEENRLLRKALENSLLAQVDFSESFKQEKYRLDYKLEEEENKIEYLQLHVFILEQALKEKETKASEQVSFRREFDSVVISKCNVEKTNEFEKESFIKEKNMATNELMQKFTSLEKDFISSFIPFNSQLAEKHAEIIKVQQVCEKITEAEALAIIEFEEKKLMIEELDDDINDMEHKLKLQEENLNQLKKLAFDIEMEIEAKQLKIEKLSEQMENKLRGSNVLLQKIKMENKSLLENGTNLVCDVLGLGDKMDDCATADTNLDEVWRNLVQSFDKDCVGGMSFKKDGDLFIKENMIVNSSAGLNKPENFCDIRSPFKELDNKLQ